MQHQEILDDLLKLSVSERIYLVKSLWESIAVQPKDVSMTEARCTELDRRPATLERGELENAYPSEGSKHSVITAGVIPPVSTR